MVGIVDVILKDDVDDIAEMIADVILEVIVDVILKDDVDDIFDLYALSGLSYLNT